MSIPPTHKLGYIHPYIYIPYIYIYLFMHIWIHIPHNHGSILDFNWKCTSKYLGPIKAMGPMSYHPPIWSPSLNRPDNGHQEVSLGWHHLRHVMMAPFFESGFFERWDNVIISPSYLTIILFHFVSYVFWQFEVEFFPAIALAKGQVCRNLQTSWLIIMVLELCGRKWWSPLYN